MHTLSAFYAAITGNSTLVTIPAVQDQAVTVNNNAIVPFTDRRLLNAYAGGKGTTQFLLSSPSLSDNGKPAIYPIDSGDLGGNLPAMVNYMQNGLVLPGREQVSVQGSYVGTGPDDVAALLWHAKAFMNAPPGPYKTIPATIPSVIAGTAFTWTLQTFELTAGLRRGRYACVGMAVEGPSILAARLVFPEIKERPGCICEVDATMYTWDYFRNGNMGLFGYFDNDNLPQIELFGVAAFSGTPLVYLDIIDIPKVQ